MAEARRNGDLGVLSYAQEVTSGVASLLQEFPAVGELCKTFLSFEQLVETAKSNKEELAVLRELCDVVIKGVLERCSDRSDPYEGLAALAVHVERAKAVAKQCGKGGVVKQVIMSRKTSRDIASVKKKILDLSIMINMVIGNDLHVSDIWYQDATAVVYYRAAGVSCDLIYKTVGYCASSSPLGGQTISESFWLRAFLSHARIHPCTP